MLAVFRRDDVQVVKTRAKLRESYLPKWVLSTDSRAAGLQPEKHISAIGSAKIFGELNLKNPSVVGVYLVDNNRLLIAVGPIV